MTKYRRIEINAFRRRVTLVSGEWRPGVLFEAPPAPTDDEFSLNDSADCEPVEPDSPEGQMILVEALLSLEQRLTPEARALTSTGHDTLAPKVSSQNWFYLKLQSFYQLVCPKALRVVRKEK